MALGVVFIALPFVLDANQFRPELESRLSSALGREVKLGKLRISLLSGSVAVDDITIADNPEFSHSPFLNAKSLRVSVELKPLIFSKSVRIQGITLDHPLITLISSKTGKWNFSDLGSRGTGSNPSNPGKSAGFSGASVLIKQLRIVEGQVTMVHGDTRQQPSIYSNVNFEAADLSYTTAFPFSLTASLPGQGTLKLEGKAGPFSSIDMMMTPLQAEFEVKRFDLLSSGFTEAESGLAGIFDFSGTITSDGRQVRSKGQASADKLQFSKAGSPANRPVALQYNVSYDLADRTGTLRNATIESGKATAHLNGTYEARDSNLRLQMTLQGTAMPVDDVTALFPAFGITLPKGASLKGGALNANMVAGGPVEKMVIAGSVDIAKTHLTGFDLSGKMAPLAVLAGLQPSQDTEIDKFSSRLNLTSEGIQVSNLLLVVPALGELSGLGRIAGDQSLDFTMQAVLKPAGAIGTELTRLVKGGSLNVPFFVRGTASNPRFVPDVEKAAGSLLGSAIGQGKKEGQTNTGDMIQNTLRDLFKKKK